MKQKESLKIQSQEVLDLLSEYSKAFSLLEKYDTETLTEPEGAPAKFVLKYEDSVKIIKNVRAGLIGKKGTISLFGSERGGMFEGIIKNIYQTFDGQELYGTIERKAANLLYLVVKDHPFSDGNKRLGAFLFVYFLNKNNFLYYNGGKKNKINNNTLVALTLLIAESNPKEKDAMVKIIINILD